MNLILWKIIPILFNKILFSGSEKMAFTNLLKEITSLMNSLPSDAVIYIKLEGFWTQPWMKRQRLTLHQIKWVLNTNLYRILMTAFSVFHGSGSLLK